MSLATSNAFAVLQQSKGKKKGSSKSEGDKKKNKSKQSDQGHTEEIQPAIFTQPSLAVTNWADDEDEDEFADHDDEWTEAKPGGAPVFAPFATQTMPDSPAESEEDEEDEHSDHVDLEAALGVEFAKSDDEEAHDREEGEEHAVAHRDGTSTSAAAQAPQKLTPEQMLSKKAQKQKELEELNAVFAELGIDIPNPDATAATEGARKKKKEKKKVGPADGENAPLETNGSADGEVMEASSVPAAKKSSSKVNEKQADGQIEEEQPAQLVDPAAAKKALLAKKKAASKKDTSAAARAAAAAAEAKARAKKLQAKKDKTHYNQAPTR